MSQSGAARGTRLSQSDVRSSHLATRPHRSPLPVSGSLSLSLSPPLLSAHTVPAGHTRHVASARALRSPPTGGEKRTLAQPRGHPRRRAAPENEQRQTSLPARACTLQTPDIYSARQRTPEHSSALSRSCAVRINVGCSAEHQTKTTTYHSPDQERLADCTNSNSLARYVGKTNGGGGDGNYSALGDARCAATTGWPCRSLRSPVCLRSDGAVSPFRRRSESGLSSPLRACLPPAPVPVS